MTTPSSPDCKIPFDRSFSSLGWHISVFDIPKLFVPCSDPTKVLYLYPNAEKTLKYILEDSANFCKDKFFKNYILSNFFVLFTKKHGADFVNDFLDTINDNFPNALNFLKRLCRYLYKEFCDEYEFLFSSERCESSSNSLWEETQYNRIVGVLNEVLNSISIKLNDVDFFSKKNVEMGKFTIIAETAEFVMRKLQFKMNRLIPSEINGLVSIANDATKAFEIVMTTANDVKKSFMKQSNTQIQSLTLQSNLTDAITNARNELIGLHYILILMMMGDLGIWDCEVVEDTSICVGVSVGVGMEDVKDAGVGVEVEDSDESRDDEE